MSAFKPKRAPFLSPRLLLGLVFQTALGSREALYLIPCGAIWSLWQFFFLQFDSSEERSSCFAEDDKVVLIRSNHDSTSSGKGNDRCT